MVDRPTTGEILAFGRQLDAWAGASQWKHARALALPLSNFRSACLVACAAIERLADSKSDAQSQLRSLADIQAWASGPLSDSLHEVLPLLSEIFESDVPET